MKYLARLGLLLLIITLSFIFMDSMSAKFPLGVLTGVFLATADWQEFVGRWRNVLNRT